MAVLADDLQRFLALQVTPPAPGVADWSWSELREHGVGELPRPAGTTLSNGASEVSSRRRSSSPAVPPHRRRTLVIVAASSAAVLAAGGIVATILPDGSSPRNSLSPRDGSNSPTALVAEMVPTTQPPEPSSLGSSDIATPALAVAPPEVGSSEPKPQESASGALPIANHIDSNPHSPERQENGSARTELSATRVPSEANTVRVTITNGRPGLVASVDGRTMPLPLRLPRDRGPHAITFTSPKCRPETLTLRAEKDQTITLQNRPQLYVP